jgi:hypothetical protein
MKSSFQAKALNDFGRSVRGLTTGLWRGDIDFATFRFSLESAISRHYENAWWEGAGRCGITRADGRNLEEQSAFDRERNIALGRIDGFADSILRRTRAEGYKLGPHLSRAAMWTNHYNRLIQIAATRACADRKFKWVLGPTREHCTDCARYAGRVYRASVWARYGARPQSRQLECGGWRCQCQLQPTDEPVTPGRPPSPTGG